MLGIVMRTEKHPLGTAVQSADHSVRRRDRTKIPTQLRASMKQRTEPVFDAASAHYNLDMPSRFGALSYTQEKRVDVGRGHQANESSAVKKVAIIQRIRNNVVQRCGTGEGDTDTIQIGTADLATLRNKLDVPETNTIAVGKTNVKGLEGITFEGKSPKVRKEAGLKDLDEMWPERNIRSPGNNPLFTRHAEEELVNHFDIAVQDAGINPEDVSGVLKIHQSNPKGVCPKCIQGLGNDNVSPGVLKQLSMKYPNLRIEVTSEILPDVTVTGKSNFVIQNGQYVE